ncbi:MAG: hypothetical protein JW841_16970 [Deltaproteobacteria bacterium]|nr:hypothetical protein [Deltaproteobacteria bacterium]
MFARIKKIFLMPIRYHVWGSFLIVVFATAVISGQVADRQGFANGELYSDVIERWGAPIDQVAPSVRYVQSGTVFNSLKPLVLSQQKISVDASMNYRKRGLVYFSGFDFSFSGIYEVINPEARDIDIVFVFPVSLDRNKVLLSELSFLVNNKKTDAILSDASDKIVWTGRLKKNESNTFRVTFKGRGLDSFHYRLDPSLAVKNFSFNITVNGGDNYDYPIGVVPAHESHQTTQAITLLWHYPSLESGVIVGAILPSQKSFDALISTMAARAWAPFIIYYLR